MEPFSAEKEIYTKSTIQFGENIAELIIEIGIASIKKHDSFSLAFPGGSTPVPVFDSLRSKIKIKDIDWSKVHIFWIDERCVPLNHTDSNFRICYDNFLQFNKNINYHPIKTKKEILKSALEYEKEVYEYLNVDDTGIPVFDLIMLGVGDDGHVASLFPNSEELNYKNNRILIPVCNSRKKHNRISFTVKLLNNAINRIFGILGEKKVKIYNDLKKGNENNYPLKHLITSNSLDYWVINHREYADAK